MDQRRERGARTRKLLIDSALDLFARQGYEATTVDDIANASGVTERSFFHHFPSKDDVLFDGYADRLADGTRRFRAADPGGGLWAALAAASDAIVDGVEQQPALFLLRARLYGRVAGLRASMLRINEDWIDLLAGEVARRLGVDAPTHLGARLAASLVNSANRAAIDVWAASGGGTDLRTIAQEALQMLEPTVDAIEREALVTAAARRG